MIPDRDEDQQGNGVTILWIGATAPCHLQKLQSGLLKTGCRCAEILSVFSFDSADYTGI